MDYDQSKNYRLMAKGLTSTWLLDKQSSKLEGWSPRKFERDLVAGPTHVRVAGRDAFVALHQRSLDLINRRGNSFPGFPMSLDFNLVNNYYVEPAGSFEASQIKVLSTTGEIIGISMTGGILSRDQLYKPDAETQFELIPDVLGNSFVIVRRSLTNWEVLDHEGQLLFDKSYLSRLENASIRFYRFGGVHSILSVYDQDTGNISLFGMDGQPVTSSPIKSDAIPGILFFENQNAYELYLTEGKKVIRAVIK